MEKTVTAGGREQVKHPVEKLGRVKKALAAGPHKDLLNADGTKFITPNPHAHAATLTTGTNTGLQGLGLKIKKGKK
jgi:hypothetical protein